MKAILVIIDEDNVNAIGSSRYMPQGMPAVA